MSEASLDADQVKQYDRQIRLWGFAAQQKITQARVLVHGCCGMSAEIVKNLVLAGLIDDGVGNVCLMDDAIAQEQDLGSQFLIPAECVGKMSRAEASIKSLQELNPKASIRCEKGEERILDEALLKQFDLVCVSDGAPNMQKQFQLRYPSMEQAMSTSWSKLTKGKAQVNKLFYALQLLHAMQERAGSSSAPVENAEEVHLVRDELCKRHSLSASCFEDDLFRKLAMQVNLHVSMVCSIVGGMAADHMVKALTGKEKPLRNYFIYDGRDGSGIVLDLGASEDDT
ncbi:hypothetical protein GUITHDRAFT_137429 [Guillardia theta CCMP2712]|uniref:THIF-type NAD/FAD binding fold domain-containing protein n=1 Tax=Guillardia theta (strain CCMP2712) TaxID=905079 RepID=L1JGP4_GUITC|nr:hypothetical protein GUITHDRAFT_137429 [Guillardia theta CCMP2712]EKX47676.1 hypothetical protein GUITHDRAFT_137429 [Guillardia theta CCMP2712]|eukprot:XP_005834656.1 hypothetical protein GUITHDRAFT_137429 [Guillardia theta CCMP2712]